LFARAETQRRITGKAAIKEPSHAELSVTGTWADGDTSMIDCDDGENEVEEDESSDDLHEEDEEVNDVAEVK